MTHSAYIKTFDLWVTSLAGKPVVGLTRYSSGELCSEHIDAYIRDDTRNLEGEVET